jgi:hypothetical protein
MANMSNPHEASAGPLSETDKPHFVELAKLYESSWNGLRDFEWKMAFALWATTLAATAVAVTKTGDILGYDVNGGMVLPLFNGVALFLLFVLFLSLWIAYVLAQVFIQSAFAYFGSNRDYYIKRVAGVSGQRAQPPVFGTNAPNPQAHLGWVLPFWNTTEARDWRIANNLAFLPTGWLSIFVHAFVTAALFSLSFILIYNAARPPIKQASKGVTISLSIGSP